MRHAHIALALAGSIALLSGCVNETTGPFTPPPVPPLQTEVIPNPPVTAVPLIWQPGHWNWNGSGYVWQPGVYVPQDGHGNLFMPGYWQQSATGWAWIAAHWL